MSHFARPIRNLGEQQKQPPYGCDIPNPQPPSAFALAPTTMRFCNTPRTNLRKREARKFHKRAGSAMFLELRFGADSCGGVKGQRGVCGSKTPACWNRRTGVVVGILYRNGFPKVPHVLLRRFDVLGKSDFPLVGSLSRRYCWENAHQSARKECAVRCAASACEIFRRKRAITHAAACRVRRLDTQLFPAAHAGDFKRRTRWSRVTSMRCAASACEISRRKRAIAHADGTAISAGKNEPDLVQHAACVFDARDEKRESVARG